MFDIKLRVVALNLFKFKNEFPFIFQLSPSLIIATFYSFNVFLDKIDHLGDLQHMSNKSNSSHHVNETFILI